MNAHTPGHRRCDMSPRVSAMVDTGKVRIGIAHIARPARSYSHDAALIQLAFLDKRTAKPLPFINQLIAPILRWL